VDSQQWDERYSATGFVWATGPNQFVAAELAGLPPGRAIDLAAGLGALAGKAGALALLAAAAAVLAAWTAGYALLAAR